MAERDYSHVPLARKLGVKPGSLVVLDGAPEGAAAWLEPLPDGARITMTAPPDGPAGAGVHGGAGVVLCFASEAAALQRTAAAAVPALTVDGGLWLCWPKRTSGHATDLDFDRVQRIGLGLGLVDNKSISVSPQWSGVRFVRRLRDRPPARP